MRPTHPHVLRSNYRRFANPAVLGANRLLLYAVVLVFAAVLSPLHAQSRASASYSLTTEAFGGGGSILHSTNYQVDASVGGIVGTSVATDARVLTVKHGYAGQLYDLTGLRLGPEATAVNESGEIQLAAALFADDATVLALDPSAVNWSILSGPLDSVSAVGLVRAGTVFQNTGATVGGAGGGFAATLSLTVLDVGADDFGLYAGDGLPDAWQVQYFGLNNPLAAPDAQPLHDGQSNLLKYLTGYAPDSTDARFTALGTAVGAGNFQFQLSQVVPGTRYIFQRSTDLQVWTTLHTLEPVAFEQPFIQTLPTLGTASFFRVVMDKAVP